MQFINYLGYPQDVRIRTGLPCLLLLWLQGRPKEGPPWIAHVPPGSALWSIQCLLRLPLQILFGTQWWLATCQRQRTSAMSETLAGASRISYSVCCHWCPGRMSNNDGFAIAPWGSLKACDGARWVTHTESADLCHKLTGSWRWACPWSISIPFCLPTWREWSGSGHRRIHQVRR